MRACWWEVFLKGFIVGGTMIVPGVSGGTMAMVLGIYDRLIGAVGAMKKTPGKTLCFLGVFTLGAGLGTFLVTTPLSWMLIHYEKPTLGFFVGVVAGGIPVICRTGGVERMSFENFLWLLLGTMLAVGVMLFPAKEAALARGDFIFLVTAGIPVSAALILPGISVSHFLLVLGLYESLIESIKNVEVGFLLPLGVGVALGTVLFCRLLERLLDGYPRQSCLVILGFIAGTVGEIIPMPANLMEGVICILAALGGFALISKSRKKSSLHC